LETVPECFDSDTHFTFLTLMSIKPGAQSSSPVNAQRKCALHITYQGGYSDLPKAPKKFRKRGNFG
jgi:hypothetical protein